MQSAAQVRGPSFLRGRCARLAAVAGLALLTGCAETDSFLLDPSVIGRWEHTPVSGVPILTRIASIEGPEDEWVEQTDPTPADLIPEVSEYRIGPGDRLDITLYDLPEENKFTPYQGKVVDTRGYIELPQLGSIYLNGLTVSEAVMAIQNAMKPLVANPLAAVEITGPRAQRYSVMGAVQDPGPFLIPVADYRLLEALLAAKGFSEAPDTIYVIRQTPLTEAASGRRPPAKAPEMAPPPRPGGEQLNNLIEELSKPKPPEAKPGEPKPENPAPPPQPPKPAGSPGVLQPAGQPASQPGAQPASSPPPAPPPIDLINSSRPSAPAPSAAQPTTPQPEPESADTTWIHLNGQWVKVKRPAPAHPAPGNEPNLPGNLPGPAATAPLMAQRVIRVPLHRLASGDARVNIVVRPGDVIRVPPPPSGNFFIGGQIGRPGVFQLSDQLTLSNAILAAGGFTQTAVPEKVDLTRMVGRDRLATIRLDGRAIFERTEPDIYLKANDQITIGSSFWATPLAVIRNGFRASYGFGLIADRNFGSDIFGVPPESRQRLGF